MSRSATLPTRTLSGPAQPSGDADYLLEWIGGRIGPNERRQVVILACAFDEACARVQPLDPEDLADLLADRRRAIAEIVGRYGGVVSSMTLARQIICWGWPRSGEDDSRLAVAAALEIVDHLGAQCRSALDAGIAIVDKDGRRGGDGSTLIAAAVNTAQSMLAEAPSGAILVSPTLRRLLDGMFELEPFGQQRLSGEDAQRAWRVAGAVCGRSNAACIQRVTLFGRSAERATLTRLWGEVSDGSFCRLWIEGEAGIGKTALIADLKTHIDAAGAIFIEAHCLPETQGSVLSLAHQLHEDLCDHGLALPRRCAPGDIPTAGPTDAASLAAAAAAMLRLRPAPGPIAICIEDAHWADPPSMDFILALSAQLAQTRSLMLLVTSRTAPPHSPAAAERWQTLELRRLSEQDVLAMLRVPNLTPELPEPIRHVIAHHAEGIPLYARELAWLTAQGPDRLYSESHYRLLSSPNRLNAALLARLEAVGDLKHLAQAAAVLGRLFETRLLAAVLEADEAKLRERLDALVARGILMPAHRPAGVQYRFSHTLLWSAAYGSLLKSRRRQLHARAAAELAHGSAGIVQTAPERAAHHFTKAGDHASAFAWWERAAQRADRAGKSALAIAHIDRALSARAAAPDTSTALDEARLHSLLGKQLGILHGSASAATQAAFQRALGLLSQLPARPSDLRFDIQWGLCAVHLMRCELDAAMEGSAGLIEEARASDRNDQLVVALRLHGTAKLLYGCVRDAIDLYRMVEAVYDPRAHSLIGCRYVSNQGIVCRAHLAWATAIAGDEGASLAAQRTALALAAELDHPHTSANTLGVLATAAKIRGDVRSAAALARACLDVGQARHFEYWVARARIVLAWVEARHDPERGLALSHAAADGYRKTGSDRAAAFAYCIEAELALHAGQAGQALMAVEQAERMGSISPRFIYASELLRLRAAALVELDPAQIPSALAILARAQSIAEDQGALTFARRIAETCTDLTERLSRRRFVPRPGA